MDIVSEQLFEYCRDHYRALHQIPELDRTLPETTAYLESALSGLRCSVFSPMAGALCAFFDFGAPKAIAKGDRVVAEVIGRNGDLQDVIYNVKE